MSKFHGGRHQMELIRLHTVHSHRRLSAGFTLIEALIALFVFSIALLGIAALLARSVGVSHSAYLRSVASMQAMDMAERIRANVMAGSNEYDNISCDSLPVSPPNCASTNCNAGQLASWDHTQWCGSTKDRFGGLFKSAKVGLDSGSYLISIVWQERTVTDENKQDIAFTTVDGTEDGDAIFTWRVSQ